MEEKIAIFDYVILIQLLLSLLAYWFLNNLSYMKYKSFIVLASILIFFSYWIVRIVFNDKYKELISN